MQNSIWKLTALAGVVGVGFLVVLQAQKNLSRPNPGRDLANEVVEESTEDPPPVNVAQNSDQLEPPAQFEPDPNASPIPKRSPSTDAAVQSAVHNAEGAANPFDATHASDAHAHPAPAQPPSTPALLPEAASSDPNHEFDPFAAGNQSEPEPNAANQPPANPESAPAFAGGPDDAAANGEQPNADGGLAEPIDDFQPAPDATFAGGQAPAAGGPAALPNSVIPANREQTPADDPAAMPNVASAAFEQEQSPRSRGQHSRRDPNQNGVSSGPQLLSPNPLEAPASTIPEESSATTDSTTSTADPLNETALDESPQTDAPQFGSPGGPPNALVPDPDAFVNDAPRVERISNEESQLENPDVATPQKDGGPRTEALSEPAEESGTDSEPAPPGDAVHGAEPAPRGTPAGIGGGEPNRFDPPPEAAELSSPDDHSGHTATVSTGAERPQLKIEKIAPPTAVLGQPLIYHIVVSNAGASPAHQVTVEDRIPEGAELSGTMPRAVLTGNRLIWKLGDLESGKSQKISIRVTPRTPGRIGSVATVNFVSEVASQTMVTAPKLDIALSAPPQAKVGDPVEVSFKVSNAGSGDAESVVIRSILPQELQHPGGSDLEYELGTLPAGQSKVVQLTLTAAQAGEAVSRAVVTAAGGVTVETQASLRVMGSNLVISRTGPEHRYLGRDAVYQNVVTNKSSKPIEGATLIETVPEGMDFVEATEGGQYNDGDRGIAWRIDALGPGQSKIVKVTLRAVGPGAKVSRVSAVEASGAKTEATSQTEVQGFASLGLDVPQIDGPVGVGEPVTLRISTRNRGNFEASNVKLKLTIPAELEVVSIKAPVRYTQSGQTVEFAPQPRIAANGSTDYEVALKAARSGDVRIGIEIHADQMQRPLRREEAVVIFPKNQ